MESSGKQIDNFEYIPGDFHFTLKLDEEHSKLDSIIHEKYLESEKNGILRYKLGSIDSKLLPGDHQFLVQLNLERARNRRTPEDIVSMETPFDPEKFNFKKIKDNEIYFKISNDESNVVISNVSPIEFGHCMLISERLRGLPQIITKRSVIQIIELFLLSSSTFLRAAFNSLCAYSSVNHLHWHLYYLKHQMLLEKIEVEHLAGPVFTLESFPSKGFCIKFSSIDNRNVGNFASWVFLIVDHLQKRSCAHNVYITRATSSPHDDLYDDIRVYIWGRTPTFGVKDTGSFLPAACELFGHLSIRTEDTFRDITEDQVASILQEITGDVFKSLKDGVKSLAENSKID